MGVYAEKDGEPGEMVTCSSCHGWDVSETGVYCMACEGQGVVFDPFPQDDLPDADDVRGILASEHKGPYSVRDRGHIMSQAIYEFREEEGGETYIRRFPYGQWLGPYEDRDKAIEGMMTVPCDPREAVYDAIDTERDYQNTLWGQTAEGSRPGDGTRSVDAYAAYIQRYTNVLIETVGTSDNDENKLEVMRKIAGLCVVAMEQHGAPKRK